MQHCLPVAFMLQYLAHRHGVWRIADKLLLVDVQPDTDYGLAYSAFGESVFYQYAADFSVAGIYVVGPLHARFYSEVSHCTVYGDGSLHRDYKLLLCRNVFRSVPHGEREVFSRLAFPLVASASASGSLTLGSDDKQFVATEVNLLDVAVRRVGAVDMQYAYFHAFFLVKCKNTFFSPSIKQKISNFARKSDKNIVLYIFIL